MARTLSRASQAYTPGNYGPFAINALTVGDNGFNLTFTRVAWPSGIVAIIRVDISMDNGASFTPWIECPMSGGVVLDKLGAVQTAAEISGKWPGENDGSGGRRVLRQTDVRFTAQVLQTITTAITLGPI